MTGRCLFISAHIMWLLARCHWSTRLCPMPLCPTPLCLTIVPDASWGHEHLAIPGIWAATLSCDPTARPFSSTIAPPADDATAAVRRHVRLVAEAVARVVFNLSSTGWDDDVILPETPLDTAFVTEWLMSASTHGRPVQVPAPAVSSSCPTHSVSQFGDGVLGEVPGISLQNASLADPFLRAVHTVLHQLPFELQTRTTRIGLRATTFFGPTTAILTTERALGSFVEGIVFPAILLYLALLYYAVSTMSGAFGFEHLKRA
eukprot:m.117501 g.117501  ORF g.117501 m.117501 type:complete len:260 (+) comp9210_c0_seq1:996-1775(+)